jgi:predicted enzyme related to lactoylglutathione lyase
VGGGIAQGDGPRVMVYVQVVDPIETLRLAEELGGRSVMQPMDVPGGPTIAQLEDPEGNRVGLVKQ